MKNLIRKDNEAIAIGKNVRVSPRKASLVLDTIRGKRASDALNILKFSKRGIAVDIRQILNSAVANAENNYQYDIDNLYIKEAYVGKSIVMKRFRPRAKGRASPIKKPFARITIVLGEKKETKQEAKK